MLLLICSFEASGGTLGDLTYRISDGEVTITDCKASAEGKLVIPAEIEGLPVTSIEYWAFSGCESLTSITIPDSVTSIGIWAFSYCRGLTSITIPESVTSIGDYVFSGCSSLTTITIPEGVTSIGHNAFENCESLASITIPEGVTSIRDEAFEGCTSLTSINLPDMFQSAGELWRMRATAALIFGEDDLLSYAQGYNQIVITVCKTTAEGELVIPAEIEGFPVTSIGLWAFWNCSSLTSITIPDSVTSIGVGGFSGCSSLTSITIPEGVTSIGVWAFWYCEGLTSITIPDSVTSIGDWAFESCESLTSIELPVRFQSPNQVRRIGAYYAFSTVVDGAVTYLLAYGQVGVTDCDNKASGAMEILAEIEGLPVTSIGGSAFLGCRRLTSITIPDSVTSIGNNAFHDCSSLTSITIPDGVTSIGDYVFYNCSSLTSITIPDSVTSIGDRAFDDCTSLTSVTIPDSVTSIGNYAFQNCSNLTSITIPESVTGIGFWAFRGCRSLTSVTIPAAFHSQLEASRLRLGIVWPDGFFLPSSITRTPELSIRLPIQLVVTGDQNTQAVIEATENLNNPWTEWRTVVIGEEGTNEVDLDEGAEKRFYRVRD